MNGQMDTNYYSVDFSTVSDLNVVQRLLDLLAAINQQPLSCHWRSIESEQNHLVGNLLICLPEDCLTRFVDQAGATVGVLGCAASRLADTQLERLKEAS